MEKKTSLQIHARKRLQQRFGLEWNKETRAEITKIIHQGQATILEKQSRARTVYSLEYQDQTIRVVWDHNRQEVITFLQDRELYICRLKTIYNKVYDVNILSYIILDANIEELVLPSSEVPYKALLKDECYLAIKDKALSIRITPVGRLKYKEEEWCVVHLYNNYEKSIFRYR